MDSLERRLRERIQALSPAERERLAGALDVRTPPAELVAVVRPDGPPPSHEALRSHARARLPDYMVPRRFVFADTLPRTSAGKLDRRALTAHVGSLLRELETPHDPPPQGEAGGLPVTETEKALADIWAAVLGSDEVFLDDDFFELGGDSLLSIRVIARAKQAGYSIDPQQFFATPTIAALAAAADEAKTGSVGENGVATPAGQAGDEGSRESGSEGTTEPAALPSRGSRRAPLSFAQEGFWFLDRLDPGDPAYNVAVRIDLRGPLEGDRLAPGFREVLRRHDALRGTVRLDGGDPWLDALPAERFALERVDLAHLPHPEAGVQALTQETARHRFDLLGGPLVRGVLARLAPEHHALLLTFHHMVLDGESVRLVLEDLGATYRDSADGAVATEVGAGSRGDRAPSYRDYTTWERERWSAEGSGADSLRYWAETLADVPERIDWPPDDRAAEARSDGGATAARQLPLEVVGAVAERCNALGCTPFVLLLAAYQIFLHRHSGQGVVMVGTPVAHRPHPALERAVGYFQNMLPLRGELGDDPTFSQFVARTRDVVAGALAHADVPFERIVEAATPHRNPKTTPLFQTAFTFRDGTRPDGWRSALDLPGVEVDAAILHNGAAKFEMALEIERTDEGLTLLAEYAVDRFGPEAVALLLDRFEVLLRGALSTPDEPISTLPAMTPWERRTTLGPWSSGSADEGTASASEDLLWEDPRDPTVLEQVEAVASEAPGRMAISDGEGSLTYGELVAGAAELAAALRRQGVGPESLVAVALTPSRAQVVSLLGSWKAGGGFLALDPDHPPARLRAILQDAGSQVVVTDHPGAADWVPEGIPVVSPTKADVPPLPKDGSSDELSQGILPEPEPPSPNSLAYVIYSS